jgi:hypothetical protein
MYTFSYIFRLFVVLYTIMILIWTYPRAIKQERIVIIITVVLLFYIIVWSSSFASWLRAPSHKSKQQVIPLGSGWSFYINKKSPHGKVYPTRLVHGLQPNGRWGSGTMIKEVQMYLTQRGESLSSYPSVENGTLGGWIASGSHGSGGNLWKSGFGQATVKNLETGEIYDVKCSEVFNRRKSIEECRKFLIIDVEIFAVPNVWCKKEANKILTVDHMQEFLSKDTYLRMLQVGRRGIMALTWSQLSDLEAEQIDHVDPHFGSQLGLWLQADILSKVQSKSSRHAKWFEFPVEPRENYTSRIRLADANRFTYEPPLLLTPIGLAYINFEIFIFDELVNANMLWNVCDALCDLFTKQPYGRCEVRCGKKLLFLDFVILRTSPRYSIFQTLFTVLGPVQIALHRGKAQVDTQPFIQD